MLNLGLSVPSPRTGRNAENTRTKSASSNDGSSPSVSGSASSAFLAESGSDIGSSFSCRASNASYEVWNLQLERVRQEYELEIRTFKSFILREVEDVVRQLIDKVVDAHSFAGTRRYYQKPKV